ncbi:hypothetical protein JCM19236_1186 [Vibrio sp. JCM 19236]|nr:hypothetical protein JCM19236_1186 [Vibrio sp. JCM 19236]
MKINKITPLTASPKAESITKPILLISVVLTLVIAALWFLWPTILIKSIHFQKVYLDYLTEQFYTGDTKADLIILGVCFYMGYCMPLAQGMAK